ncbi:MAG TPA: GNAT family N-acetyltransferase [Rhizomicrobium sp.]|nr:GNAT family N-acetyltransferase [Rhizomicrobium sp.]
MPSFNVKQAATDAEIRRVYPVMRELRPHIASEQEFLERVRRQQKQSGWRLIYVEDDGAPVAAAGFRVSEWLAWGKALYVDDLICLPSHRAKGFAEALMVWMEEHARKEACREFHLDSGTHRLGAHRFYHRMKLVISSFHFQKKL